VVEVLTDSGLDAGLYGASARENDPRGSGAGAWALHLPGLPLSHRGARMTLTVAVWLGITIDTAFVVLTIAGLASTWL
jgi:hypothetical protein